MAKKNSFVTKLAKVLVAFILYASAASAQNVTVSITGIESSRGQVIIKVFKDQAGFKDNKAVKTLKFPKSGISKGNLVVKCDMPPGVWGFALLDDENGNGKMDKNMFEIPKEGFGFSNFYLSGMSRPVFDDFKFEIKEQPVKVTMKLRYM